VWNPQEGATVVRLEAGLKGKPFLTGGEDEAFDNEVVDMIHASLQPVHKDGTMNPAAVTNHKAWVTGIEGCGDDIITPAMYQANAFPLRDRETLKVCLQVWMLMMVWVF